MKLKCNVARAQQYAESPGSIKRFQRCSVGLVGVAAAVALYSAPVASAATLYWNGSGTWTTSTGASRWSLTGSSPFTTTWSSGSDAIFNVANSTINLGPTSVANITANENVTIGTGDSSFIFNNSTLTVAGGKTFDLGGISFSTSSAITKAGSGALTLTGNASYTGGFTLSEGTVNIAGNNALGAGALALNGGTLQVATSAAARTPNTTSISIGGNIEFGAGGSGASITFSAATALGGGVRQITVSNTTSPIIFSGVISGSAGNGVTKLGAGTLRFSGASANTYSGTTTVSNGTLDLQKSASVNAIAGNLTINGGGITYGSNNEQISNTSNVSMSSGTLAFGARTETIGQASPALGSFSMTGGTASISSGILNLNRNPSVSGGLIQISTASGVVNANADLQFSGGTIDFQSTSNTSTAALNLRGGDSTGITYLNTGTSTATISSEAGGTNRVSLNTTANASTTFNIADSSSVGTEMIIGAIVTGGSTNALIKQGTGKLVLGGANTYSGGTTISAGTLVANAPRVGSLTSSSTGTNLVTIQSANPRGAVLAGTGGVGSVQVNNRGVITAGAGAQRGDATGTLTSGAQEWANGGTYAWKLVDPTAGTGAGGTVGGTASSWDSLTMSSLNLTSTTTAFTIALVNATGGGFPIANGKTFKIADINGTLTVPGGGGDPTTNASLASALVLDVSGLGLANGSFSYSFVPDGSNWDLQLSVNGDQNAAPEPTTAALFCLGGSVLLGRRRWSAKSGGLSRAWLGRLLVSTR